MKEEHEINEDLAKKLLQYCYDFPYEQQINDIEDFRVKEFKEGIAELGKELNIEDEKELEELNEILFQFHHFQALRLEEDFLILGNLINISSSYSSKKAFYLTSLPTLVHEEENMAHKELKILWRKNKHMSFSCEKYTDLKYLNLITENREYSYFT